MSITSFSVFATEKFEQDNDQLLLASCQTLSATPEQKNAKHCIHFIQGFLAATQILDPLIIKKQSKKSRKPQSFMRSSYRPMRYGLNAPSLLFCIPKNEPETNVINVISKQLATQKYTKKMLGDVLLTALKTKYPCEKA